METGACPGWKAPAPRSRRQWWSRVAEMSEAHAERPKWSARRALHQRSILQGCKIRLLQVPALLCSHAPLELPASPSTALSLSSPKEAFRSAGANHLGSVQRLAAAVD